MMESGVDVMESGVDVMESGVDVMESRRDGRILAGGVSHRIASQTGCAPAGALETPRHPPPLPGRGACGAGPGGSHHRLISNRPSGTARVAAEIA
jgi:hypothetical protein